MNKNNIDYFVSSFSIFFFIFSFDLLLADSLDNKVLNKLSKTHAVSKSTLTSKSMIGKIGGKISIERRRDSIENDPLNLHGFKLESAPIPPLFNEWCVFTKDQSEFTALAGIDSYSIRQYKKDSENYSVTEQAKWLLYATIYYDDESFNQIPGTAFKNDVTTSIVFKNNPLSPTLKLLQKASCAPFENTVSALNDAIKEVSKGLGTKLTDYILSGNFEKDDRFWAKELRKRAGKHLKLLKELLNTLNNQTAELTVDEYLVFFPYQRINIIKKCEWPDRTIETRVSCWYDW